MDAKDKEFQELLERAYLYEERAAIMEFEGGMTREKAERAAKKEMSRTKEKA